MSGKARLILAIGLLAMLSDTMTGALLMAAPKFTLDLMGVTVDPVSLVYLRYIGAFVFAVGTCYIYGLWAVRHRGSWSELREVFIMTAWLRLVICLFTAGSILTGGLGTAWLSVPVTDGILALVQAVLLLSGPWPARSK